VEFTLGLNQTYFNGSNWFRGYISLLKIMHIYVYVL